jgi:hypothetical protein
MKITQVNTPDSFQEFPSQNDSDLVELFDSPLEASYNWDYKIEDNRIRKIYELGKERAWNPTTDIDWTIEHPGDINVLGQWPEGDDPFWFNYRPYRELSDDDKREFQKHKNLWQLSSILHGEQMGAICCGQLVSCAPTFQAKLYAAQQAADEARHAETMQRYIKERYGCVYPIQDGVKHIFDKALASKEWDLKFIIVQIVVEGLALSTFQICKERTNDPLLAEIMDYILQDEARHITFGINYLTDYLSTLNKGELEYRANYALECCQTLLNRVGFTSGFYRQFGWHADDAHNYACEFETTELGKNFKLMRKYLLRRVIPNIKRIGLLTDKVRPYYDELGLLEFEDLPDDMEAYLF